MKILVSFVLIVFTLTLFGCGSKYSDETYIKETAAWVENKENIAEFLNAAGLDDEGTFDEGFLMQQVIDGKVYFMDKEAKVAVIDELNNGKVIEIKFLQGRYKNKVGYTVPELVVDLKKEKEQAELEKSRTVPFGKLSSVDKQSYESLLRNGVQFSISLSNYETITGETNLPDGTKIKVSGVETIVTKGKLSVKLAAPPGKQLSIRILEEKFQPVNVRTINVEIIKNKNDDCSILAKDFIVDVR